MQEIIEYDTARLGISVFKFIKLFGVAWERCLIHWNLKAGKYNWPSEPHQVWRHVTNYSIVNSTGAIEYLLGDKFEEKSLSLVGILLPRPGEISGLMKHRVHVKSYSIDFGKTPVDSNRGLWVEGDDLCWYQLEQPSSEYYPNALRMQDVQDGFFDIYDTLFWSEFDIDFDQTKEQYVCKHPIQEVYASIQKALNRNYLTQNYKFVIDNLKNVIDFKSSGLLKQSILSFGDLQQETPEPIQTSKPPTIDLPSNQFKPVIKRKVDAVVDAGKVVSIEGRLLCKRKADTEEPIVAKRKHISRKPKDERRSEQKKDSQSTSTMLKSDRVSLPYGYASLEREIKPLAIQSIPSPVNASNNRANVEESDEEEDVPITPIRNVYVNVLQEQKDVIAKWKEFYFPGQRATPAVSGSSTSHRTIRNAIWQDKFGLNNTSISSSSSASGNRIDAQSTNPVVNINTLLEPLPFASRSESARQQQPIQSRKKIRIATQNNVIIRFYADDPPNICKK